MTGNKEAGLFDTTKPAASEKLSQQQQRDSPRDNTKSRQEQEEKLIMTAWKNMQQHSLCEDSRAAGLPQSFLAQQRRSTQARRALSPRLEPR